MDRICFLCESGELEALKAELTAAQAVPGYCDQADQRGYVPLLTAIFNYRNGIAKYLVEKGYSSPTYCLARNRTTALHVAAYRFNNDAIPWLVSKGARVNSRDAWGKTPLHHCSFHANVKGIRLLLKEGARTDIRDRYGQVPIHLTHLDEVKQALTSEEGTGAPRS